MIKIDKNLKKLINFFKQTGYYNKQSFDYIFDHTQISEESNFKEFDSINNYINNDIKNNKLNDFYITIPKITDVNTMLVSIYIIAHALNRYKNLGEEIKKSNLAEVLPVSLVRIYSVIYGDKRLQLKISSWQEEKLNNDCLEELLIAYDSQFLAAESFVNTSIILLPDSFFIDDIDNAKSRVSFNLWSTIEICKTKK